MSQTERIRCAICLALLRRYICTYRVEYINRRQKLEIAYHLLQTLSYAHPKHEKPWLQIGIDRLVEIGGFSDHFPPHDCSLSFDENGWTKENNAQEINKEKPSKHEKCKYLRYFLHAHWANFRCLFKRQPIDHVREYFGEELAFYFHWLGVWCSFLTIQIELKVEVHPGRACKGRSPCGVPGGGAPRRLEKFSNKFWKSMTNL